MPPADGILLLNKPPGATSFAALKGVKEALRTGKVGHTGTLDKFAEGLLVALAGRFTRLAPHIVDLDKTYYAVIEMGRETTTLDPEGETVRRGPIPEESTLHEKKGLFTGRILQSPPAFSAVRLGGERAYRRALRGEDLEIPKRPVDVHEFSLLEWTPPFLRVRVRCGKGTYIRSLARDFGEACGSCAGLAALRRTRVGPFDVEDAFDPRGGVPGDAFHRGLAALRTLFSGRILTVRDARLQDLSAGRDLSPAFFREPPAGFGPHLVFSEGGDLAAFIDYGEGGFSYRFVAAEKK